MPFQHSAMHVLQPTLRWQGEGRPMGLAEQGSSCPSCQSGRAQIGTWGCLWLMTQNSLR